MYQRHILRNHETLAWATKHARETQKGPAKAYLKVSGDRKHPLHEKVGRVTKTRIKRGSEWMTQAASTMSLCCDVAEIRTRHPWVPVKDVRFIQVIAPL